MSGVTYWMAMSAGSRTAAGKAAFQAIALAPDYRIGEEIENQRAKLALDAPIDTGVLADLEALNMMCTKIRDHNSAAVERAVKAGTNSDDLCVAMEKARGTR